MQVSCPLSALLRIDFYFDLGQSMVPEQTEQMETGNELQIRVLQLQHDVKPQQQQQQQCIDRSRSE